MITNKTKSLLASFALVYSRKTPISRAQTPYARARKLARECIAKGDTQVQLRVLNGCETVIVFHVEHPEVTAVVGWATATLWAREFGPSTSLVEVRRHDSFCA